MRVFHIAVVVSDLDESAEFYQEVFGFRPLGRRRPGNFPGMAFDLTDDEIHFSLLQADDGVAQPEWSKAGLGPNHVGVVVEHPADIREKLLARGNRIFGERYSKDGGAELVYFKCIDPNGAEIDVSKKPFDLTAR